MTTSQTILVVDDDPRWRQIVADVLADAGYKTVLAPAAPAALPPCQAAVVDVSLDPDDPGNRDGLALAAKLGPAPVILLSGAPESEIAEFARTRPFIAGHIEKSSFRKEALLALLGRALTKTASRSGPSRVLIVEDDPGLAQYLLRHAGGIRI